MPVSLAATSAAGTSGALVPIATIRGNNAATQISFSNIPQIYQDLMVVASGNLSLFTGNPGYTMWLNGNFTNIYSVVALTGDGATLVSSSQTPTAVFYPNLYLQSPSVTFPETLVAHFPNYRNTSINKTALFRVGSDRNGSGRTTYSIGLAQTTSAITAIDIGTNWGDSFFASGFTANLYGIRAGN